MRSARIQKLRTWDFAAKFIVRKTLLDVTDKQSLVEFGKWTKNELVTLGPTFIKLGQAVSTRRDVFPVEFAEQFESLQDDVPPMDPDDVLEVLGTQNLFASFVNEPYKSASLGQVHQATLKSGTPVIVKIQRSGIREILKNDIQNITEVLDFLDTFGVSTGPSAKTVFQESTKYIFDEIDYTNECRNAQKFGSNFGGTPWLIVPKVYPEYSTDKILVMEFVPSTKILETRVNRKKLCEALISCFVNQVMEYGFFHADPHPGNLGITGDGKLVIYDYGLVVDISPELTNGMRSLLGAVIQRDTRKIVEIMIDLNIIIPTADTDDIALFFDALIGYLESMDGKALNDELIKNELSNTLAKEKPFLLPSSFIFLARSFSMIDGLCKQLDPEFTFYTYLEPMVKKEVADVIDLRKMAMFTFEMPSRIRSINSSMVAMEKSRGTMKRSFEKTYEYINLLQISMLVNLISMNFIQADHGEAGIFCIMVTFILLMKSVQKK